MKSDPQVLVARYFGELLNARDFSRAGEILTPDFVFFGPTEPAGLDQQGFEAFLVGLQKGFSDKHFTEVERLSLGDRWVSRFRMTGTHDGSFRGIPASGRRTDVEGCDIFYLRSGRIARVRAYFDLLALLLQIGASPPSSSQFPGSSISGSSSAASEASDSALS
ncbi:MAG: ester cyclase [Deltaproteobacteria bacterium]|nr:ester cyclase [Deltaproteobacteria bacterium]